MSNKMKHKILESKQYFEDSTEEEVAAIRSRVSIYTSNIILLKEVHKPTEFTVAILFDEVERLSKELDNPSMLADVRDASVPNSKVRKAINERFKGINQFVDHVSYCVGGNILIQAVARFVMYNTKLDSYSIHKSIEDAEKALEKKMNQ